MTEIRAVVFDYGGVIINPPAAKLVALAEDHGINISDLALIMMGPRGESTKHPFHALERGEFALSELQERLEPVARHLGVTLRGDEVDVLWEPATTSINHDVVTRIEAMAGGVRKIALLTNVNAEFLPTMREHINFDCFDEVVASALVGARKPEPLIYQRTEEALGVSGSEIVFLDDSEANLAAAQARDWQCIHVTDPSGAMDELDTLLDG